MSLRESTKPLSTTSRDHTARGFPTPFHCIVIKTASWMSNYELEVLTANHGAGIGPEGLAFHVDLLVVVMLVAFLGPCVGPASPRADAACARRSRI